MLLGKDQKGILIILKTWQYWETGFRLFFWVIYAGSAKCNQKGGNRRGCIDPRGGDKGRERPKGHQRALL